MTGRGRWSFNATASAIAVVATALWLAGDVSYLPVSGDYELVWSVLDTSGGRRVSRVAAREPLLVRDRDEPVDVPVAVPSVVRALIDATRER